MSNGLHKRFKVAVIHGTDMACFREVVRGIYKYASARASWHLDLVSPNDDFLNYLRIEKPDGVLLGGLSDHEERVEATNLVAHCVSAIGQHSPTGVRRIPEVEADDLTIGRMAANYFFDKGFHNLAFMGAEATWSRTRWQGFEERAIELGCQTRYLQHTESGSPSGRGWVRPHYGDEIIAWLQSLPKPVGVMACNDIRGRELTDLCLEAGLLVPDQIAVLGVDNDDLECELAHPPLSSVSIPWREAGFRSAALLNDLLQSRPVAPVRNLVLPTEVIERQSTDTLAIEDEDVAAALRFIREHAHEKISVNDILRAVPAARRSLEKRFRAVLGRSPLEEIRRAHITRAKHLLATTDLSMPEIAEVTGFTSAAWFSKAFHHLTGQGPAEFRQNITKHQLDATIKMTMRSTGSI